VLAGGLAAGAADALMAPVIGQGVPDFLAASGIEEDLSGR
jgi:hypothetical protein